MKKEKESKSLTESVKKNKILIIILSVFFLLIILSAGGSIYYQRLINKDSDKLNEIDLNFDDTEEDNDKEEEPDDNTKPVETNDDFANTIYEVSRWNNNSVYIPNQSFFNDSMYDNYKFYNIATLRSGETVVRAVEPIDDMFEGWWHSCIFVINDNNKTEALMMNCNVYSEELSEFVFINEEDIIYDIYPTNDTVIIDNVSYSYWYEELLENAFDAEVFGDKKIGVSKYGDMYRKEIAFSDYMYQYVYFLITPDKYTLHYYEIEDIDIQNDDSTLKVNWNDDENKSASFFIPTTGCEAFYAPLYLNDFVPSESAIVGTIKSNGQPIYKLTDESLLNVFYDEYYFEGYEGHDLSFEEFKNKVVAVIYKDSINEWKIVVNSLYSSTAECGKPVIYLYPEEDTYVNVKVGAEITISDPVYKINGWQDVFAKTDGTLIYKEKEYDSLFWEGFGYGKYPDLTGIGKIVRQSDLIATIEKDLKAQGLNDKEIADFMEFWKDNLPTSPYVKLAWLTTDQMNELAPLSVYPRPDTVIRVFMDARGLQAPIDLIPQKFEKLDRNGFTLIEWGGLLVK